MPVCQCGSHRDQRSQLQLIQGIGRAIRLTERVMLIRILLLCAWILVAVTPADAAEQSMSDTIKKIFATPTPPPRKKKSSSARKKKSPTPTPTPSARSKSSPSPTPTQKKKKSPTPTPTATRSEEHTSELQSRFGIS